jgi:hypothetical protein
MAPIPILGGRLTVVIIRAPIGWSNFVWTPEIEEPIYTIEIHQDWENAFVWGRRMFTAFTMKHLAIGNLKKSSWREWGVEIEVLGVKGLVLDEMN